MSSAALTAFVINALWQIPAVAIVAALCARAMRRAPARQQYLIWLAAVLIGLLLPVWSAIPRRVPLSQTVVKAVHAPAKSSPFNFDEMLAVRRSSRDHSRPWLLLAYSAFLAWRLAALARGWLRARRILAGAVRTDRRGAAFGVSNVPILISPETSTPITISSSIVLPTDLPSDAVDAAIAHELAHIRRGDFAANLAIEIASLPIAFHPAVAWMKRRVAQTRELACDEMVAPALIDPIAYARALVDVAALATSAPLGAIVP